MDMVQMGEFLATLRKEKKWTQAELGEKLGVTNKTVSRWETRSLYSSRSPVSRWIEYGHSGGRARRVPWKGDTIWT